MWIWNTKVVWIRLNHWFELWSRRDFGRREHLVCVLMFLNASIVMLFGLG